MQPLESFIAARELNPSELSSSGRSERRSFPRLEDPPLHLSGIDGAVIDVSLGGMGIAVPRQLRVGERYEVVLTDDLLKISQCATVMVVRVNLTTVGLQWVDATPEQMQWLRECILRWLQTGSCTVRLGRLIAP